MDITANLVRSQPVYIKVPSGQNSLLLNNQSAATLILRSVNREVRSILPWTALTSPVTEGEQLEFTSSGSLTNAIIDVAFSEAEAGLSLVPISNFGVNIQNAVIPVSGNVNANVTNAVIPVNGTVNIGTVAGPVVIDTGGGAVLVNTSPTPQSDIKLKSGPSYTLVASPQTVLAATDVSSYNGIRIVAGTMLTYWGLRLRWYDAIPGPTGYNFLEENFHVYSGGTEKLDWVFPTKGPYLIVVAYCTTIPSTFDYFDIFGERGPIDQGASRTLAQGYAINIAAGGTLTAWLQPFYGVAWLQAWLSSANVGMFISFSTFDYTLTQVGITYRRSTVGLANDALQTVRDCPIFLGNYIQRLTIQNQDAVARNVYYTVTSGP